MTPQQAEERIVALVHLVDEIRLTRNPEEQKIEIAKVEAEIRELKKITGQRRIVGNYGDHAPNVPAYRTE